MKDAIYAYLIAKESPATAPELVEKVLRLANAKPDLCEKLIRVALDQDGRFFADPTGRWHAVPKPPQETLDEATFVVTHLTLVDTGFGWPQIAEIASRRVKDGKAIARFDSLVNPGAPPLPESVQATGLTRKELAAAPSLEPALGQWLKFLGESVLVACGSHVFNALQTAAARIGEEIESRQLCVLRLARRLMPEHDDVSLHGLAAAFALPLEDLRRAEKDVDVVVEVFLHFLESLAEQGISKLDEALEFQYTDLERVDFTHYAFDREFIRQLPHKPGVYLMKDADEKVLYVGKAKDLCNRVSSYFAPSANRDDKEKEILRRVFELEYQVVGSELEALLLEAELIREHRPPLNQQVEVHERPARYGKTKDAILVLPASRLGVVELFMFKQGAPLRRVQVSADLTDFPSAVEVVRETFYNRKKPPTPTPDEAAQLEIAASWLDRQRDAVNFLDMAAVGPLDHAKRLLADHIKHCAASMEKVHYR